MFSNSDVTVGTAVVSNVGLVDRANFQRKIHGHEARISNYDYNMVFVCAGRILPENKSLPYPYTFKENDGVPAIPEDLFLQASTFGVLITSSSHRSRSSLTMMKMKTL